MNKNRKLTLFLAFSKQQKQSAFQYVANILVKTNIRRIFHSWTDMYCFNFTSDRIALYYFLVHDFCTPALLTSHAAGDIVVI